MRPNAFSISANNVHDNLSVGISTGGQVVVSNNLVWNQSNRGEIGIVSGGTVSGNQVSNNYDGIQSSGTTTSNRIDHNADAGILALGGSILGNDLYSNGVGIQVTGSNLAIANNLI